MKTKFLQKTEKFLQKSLEVKIFCLPLQSQMKGKHNRGVAQLASASGLGPEGPVFESQYPDNVKNDYLKSSGRFFCCIPVVPDIITRTVPSSVDNILYPNVLKVYACCLICNVLQVCPAWRGRWDKWVTV